MNSSVKPISRTVARLDLTGMVLNAGCSTPEEVVAWYRANHPEMTPDQVLIRATTAARWMRRRPGLLRPSAGGFAIDLLPVVGAADRAAAAIGAQIETGTIFMNRADYLDPALCWTGCKDTGRGGSLSYLGFHSVTRPKSYHLKKVQK